MFKYRIIELEKEVKHIMDDHSRFVVLDEITSDDVNVLMSEGGHYLPIEPYLV